MALALAGVDLGRGREEAYRQQHPEALKTLVEIARIQSTEASNAIEHITAPRERIEALVAEKTTPANRSEEEIAGYRSVLDTIHASAAHIPFTPSVLEQLHRDLYQFTNVRSGRWKTVENAIEKEHADGTKIVRFRTVETPPQRLLSRARPRSRAGNCGPDHLTSRPARTRVLFVGGEEGGHPPDVGPCLPRGRGRAPRAARARARPLSEVVLAPLSEVVLSRSR